MNRWAACGAKLIKLEMGNSLAILVLESSTTMQREREREREREGGVESVWRFSLWG